MKRLFYVSVILTVVSFTSCNENYKAVSHLYGQELYIDYITNDFQQDSTSLKKLSTPAKIVVYVDSSLCTPCFSKYLLGVARYLNTIKSDNLLFLIVMENSSTLEAEALTIVNRVPKLLVIEDTNNKFVENNSLSPFIDNYNAFLLDENNKIILIGDPIRNNKIRELYNNKLTQLLDKTGIAD